MVADWIDMLWDRGPYDFTNFTWEECIEYSEFIEGAKSDEYIVSVSSRLCSEMGLEFCRGLAIYSGPKDALRLRVQVLARRPKDDPPSE